MPQKNLQFGRFGASGIKGADAVARQLDQLAGYIATPVTARRGLMVLGLLENNGSVWSSVNFMVG